MYAEHWHGPVVRREPATTTGSRCSRTCASRPARRAPRYLIEVDLARDARAVPEVDELAALPLDLYAADQGLTKVTPNLMGF